MLFVLTSTTHGSDYFEFQTNLGLHPLISYFLYFEPSSLRTTLDMNSKLLFIPLLFFLLVCLMAQASAVPVAQGHGPSGDGGGQGTKSGSDNGEGNGGDGDASQGGQNEVRLDVSKLP